MPESIRNLMVDLTTCYNVNYRRWNLHDPNFIETNGSLTWRNRSSFIREDEYEQYYQKIIDDVQYSLMIGSDAVLQIYFQSNANHVCEANLAFIPKPGLGLEYFRLDFDMARARNYSHTAYHGHIGFNCREMRFSLKEYPYPSQFIRFACALAFGHRVENFNRAKFFHNDLAMLNSKFNHSIGFLFDN